MNSFKTTIGGTAAVFLLALGLNQLAEKAAILAITGSELTCEPLSVASGPTVFPCNLPLRCAGV